MHASCSQCSPPTWHVVETANFRILSYGSRGVDPQTAAACERVRTDLAKRWLPGTSPSSWTPKCDIVLHPTDEAYLREVGAAGGETVASALVERRGSSIVGRRVDVRASRGDWQTGAINHELAHVVLADRFVSQPPPRWLDEGVAILADTLDKQRRHARDFETALASRSEFRLFELIALGDYPPSDRWAAFYGQSASLVRFLVDRFGERQLLDFVEVSRDRGYEHGLRHVYGLKFAELERHWREHAQQPVAALDAMPSTPAANDLADTAAAIGR